MPESTNTDKSILDFGNVWGVDYDSTIDDSNKIRSSTGLAVNWMSLLGPMNFVIAENISKASTDKTQSFNFNLEQPFNMKNYKKFIAILLFTFIFQGTLSADIPHFLDFKYILNNSDAGSKAQKELANLIMEFQI